MKYGLRQLKAGILAVIFMILHINSCDLLRLSPFEVIRWGPGEGRYDDPDTISVFVQFSHEPDRSSVENNFSMLEDGSRVKGLIHWENEKMIFVPLSPLEKNRDYSVELSGDVHDRSGLSMDRSFEGRFSTRPDDIRVRLLDCYPGMNSVVEDPRQQIRLLFSEAVPPGSLREYVSFSPAMSGVWHVEYAQAVFTPSEPWTYGKRYEMRIIKTFRGSNGKDMGKDEISVFTIGVDSEKPCLSGAWRISENGYAEKLMEENLNEFIENSGWERTDRLRLDFSKPVDVLTVKNCLDTQGVSLPVIEKTSAYATEIYCGFEKAPVFDSRFTLTLKTGVKDCYGNESSDRYIYKIHANGSYSKPPSLVGMRIPMSPANESDLQLKSYGADTLFADFPVMDGIDKYPFMLEAETWIELYFDTAPDTAVNVFSLMELFHVNSSNNVLTFSPRRVKENNFTLAAPHSGWEEYQRLEIQGNLINTVNSGVVYIEISSGLTDTNGNKNENSMLISLLK